MTGLENKKGVVALWIGALWIALLTLAAAIAPAARAAEGIDLPRTIAWSAYPTGTGGYSQAVAIGNILQRTYKVN
ncbi:MAG: hypothetical protein RLZZ385_2129, partial [Pseudomonadota bacterium]